MGHSCLLHLGSVGERFVPHPPLERGRKDLALRYISGYSVGYLLYISFRRGAPCDLPIRSSGCGLAL